MIKIFKISTFAFSFGILLLLTSCAAESPQASFNTAPPNAFGRINQVNVIADSAVWNGPIGDSIRYFYMASYPILPQPEPVFDVRHFTIDDLRKDPLLMELRNYLIVGDITDRTSQTAAMIKKDVGDDKVQAALSGEKYGSTAGKNKWAKGQLLVYLYGDSEEAILSNLKESYAAVTQRLRKADEKMVEATAFFGGENRSVSEDIIEKMDVDIRIPGEFWTAISEEDLIWLRKETSEVSSNILIQRIPYTDQDQLSYAGIKAIRDTIGRKYISSELPDTYMQINDVDLPMIVERNDLNGSYALEARGIWEIANDFMGGAFISYLVFDPQKKDLLFLDAFVHAPGREKRDIMQELEYILKTARY